MTKPFRRPKENGDYFDKNIWEIIFFSFYKIKKMLI
jgi:hypothetical protein